MLMENKVKAVKEPKSYGHITLNSKDSPEVKNLKLGDNQTITITVEVTALRKPDRWDISEKKMKPTDIIASIEIRNIGSIQAKKK